MEGCQRRWRLNFSAEKYLRVNSLEPFPMFRGTTRGKVGKARSLAAKGRSMFKGKMQV